MDPSKIETLSDLSKLPFMMRKDLGEHYPYGLFAVPLRDIVRIHTAPGTNPNPTVTGYTNQDLKVWREMTARALAASGVTPLDILQIVFDPGLANWGRDYKDGAETLGASVIPNTPLSLEKQMMVLPDILCRCRGVSDVGQEMVCLGKSAKSDAKLDQIVDHVFAGLLGQYEQGLGKPRVLGKRVWPVS